MMREEGIEQVFVLPFDREFASLSPEEFAREILVAGVGAAAVYVGENFRFGARQAGDVRLLKQLGEQLGFLRRGCAQRLRARPDGRRALKFATLY